MATSYSVTRNQIITASMQLCGELQDSVSPTADDITTCSGFLQRIIKRLSSKNYWLWTYYTVTVPLSSATSYTIGPSGTVVTDRPLRIPQAVLRNTNPTDDQDTPLTPLSRQEYLDLSTKTSASVVNSFYYDPQLVNGVLYVYPSMASTLTGYQLICNAQKGIDDLDSDVAINMPSEAYEYIVYQLADSISLVYSTPLERAKKIERRAERLEEELADWSQEEAGTYFTITPQLR